MGTTGECLIPGVFPFFRFYLFGFEDMSTWSLPMAIKKPIEIQEISCKPLEILSVEETFHGASCARVWTWQDVISSFLDSHFLHIYIRKRVSRGQKVTKRLSFVSLSVITQQF